MSGFNYHEADEEELSELYEELSDQYSEKEEKDGMIGAAMRLVDTFSSLMGKKLWLKNGQSPCTDGHEITVPLKHPFMYQFTEHEIAHNLFQSSFKAKELFCEKYIELIESVIKKQNRTLTQSQKREITGMVGLMLNVLEDHRINTLWSTLYEGSYSLMQQQAKELLKKVKKHGATDLISYFLLVAYDFDKLPQSKYSRFEPLFREAVKKVAYKGPTATFVVGKWLLTQMVSEFIRQQQDQQQQSQGQPQQGSGQGEQQEQSDSSGAGEQSNDDSSNNSKDAPKDTPVQATPNQRIDALMSLIDSMKQSDESANATKRIANIAGDVKEDRFKKDGYGAAQKVEMALKIDMADAAIESFLRTSEAEMERVLEKIEDALQSNESNRTDDDALRRGLAGKVTFRDVQGTRRTEPMSPQDRHAASKLNERFRRINAHRKLARFDSGSAVDIDTAIYNRTNGTNDPCFLDESTGRGFQVLILLDQSGSMGGLPSLQASRATRILRRALKGPNITFDVWGFNGSSGTEIVRMPTNKDLEPAKEMVCAGNTPLAQAMHVAVNFLSRGTHKKHLLVLTDGLPNAIKEGVFGRKMNAIEAVGYESKRARKMGVHVTAIAIGPQVGRTDMTQMFGAERYWTQAKTPVALPSKMVQAVSTSFSAFLQHG